MKYEFAEQKLAKLRVDGYKCTYPNCQKKALFLAHGIAQTKTNKKKFGVAIVNHPFNLFSVCENPNHNDYFNIGNHAGKTKRIIELIEARGCQRIKSKGVWEIINNEEETV